jgi:cell division septation protein DedD
MSDSAKNPGNKQIIYFFLGFLIFFAFSFSLGVLVGKQIGRSGDRSIDDVSKNNDIETGTSGNITEHDQKTALLGKSETANGSDIGTENEGFPNENERASGVSSKIEVMKTEEPTLQSTPSSSPEIDNNAVVTAETDKRRKKLTSLPPIDPGGKYTIQIGSFVEEKTAAEILNSLKNKRYPAFVKKVEIPGYGVSYRVRIGTFGTREKAYLYGEDLKRLESNIKSVYITMND